MERRFLDLVGFIGRGAVLLFRIRFVAMGFLEYEVETMWVGAELIKDLPELTIKLGAVAKGFAVDEMIRLMQVHGLTNVYASIAGEVRGA